MAWDDFDTLLVEKTVEVDEDPAVLDSTIVETAVNDTDIEITNGARDSVTGVETPFRDWLEEGAEDDFINDAITQRPLDFYDRYDRLSLAIQHEVVIERADGSTVLTESVRTTYLGRTLLVGVLLLTGLFLANFLKYIPFNILDPPVGELLFWQLMVSFSMVLFTVTWLGIRGKEEFLSVEVFGDYSYSTYDPKIWLLTVLFFGVGISGPGFVLEIEWLRLFGGFVVVAGGVVTQFRYELFERYRLDFKVSLERYVPTISLQYVGMVVGVGFPLWMLLQIPVPNSFADYPQSTLTFIGVSIFVAMTVPVGMMVAMFAQSIDTRRRYLSDRQAMAPWPVQLFGAGTAILASCSLVVGMVICGLRFGPLVAALLVGEFGALFVLVTIVLLIYLVSLSLPITGLGAQAVHTALNYDRVWQLSRPVTPSRLDVNIDDLVRSDVQLHIVQRDDAFAASLSYGFGGNILLSQRLIDELTDRELRAIVAHEVAHLEHWDALLSFYVPIVATVLFTGRNVLYSALNFRSREFRADAFAADVVGKDALESALLKAGQVEATSDGPVFPTNGPALVPFAQVWPNFVLERPVSEPTARFLRLYYGGFALTEAHPSVEERIRALNQ